MSPYVYRGTIHDAKKPAPAPERPAIGYDPDKCGTTKGYHQHKRYKTPVCLPCAEAHNAYKRERYRAHPITTSPLNPDACGTYKGYRRHTRRKQTACEPCKQANRDQQRKETNSNGMVQRRRQDALPPEITGGRA
jgi:hypothetical protein